MQVKSHSGGGGATKLTYCNELRPAKGKKNKGRTRIDQKTSIIKVSQTFVLFVHNGAYIQSTTYNSSCWRAGKNLCTLQSLFGHKILSRRACLPLDWIVLTLHFPQLALLLCALITLLKNDLSVCANCKLGEGRDCAPHLKSVIREGTCVEWLNDKPRSRFWLCVFSDKVSVFSDFLSDLHTENVKEQTNEHPIDPPLKQDYHFSIFAFYLCAFFPPNHLKVSFTLSIGLATSLFKFSYNGKI